MPTTFVVALALVGLIIVLLILRGRSKAEEPPRFEAPKEIAKRRPKEAAEAAPKSTPPAAEKREADRPPSAAPAPAPLAAPDIRIASPPLAFPTAPPPGDDRGEDREEPTQVVDRMPSSSDEVEADQILEPSVPPEPAQEEQEVSRESVPPSVPGPRPPLRSYSSISDESVAEEIRASSVPPEPAVAKATAPAEPAAKPVSEPKIAAPKAPAAPVAKAPAAPPPPRTVSEPKMAAQRPVSEPKVAVPKPAKPAPQAKEDHDFSALNEPAPAKPAPAPATAVARFVPPSNPATAELERNDPRHAAARRLARVSVSEIKLYHEDEVKAGREAKDLYKRLGQDIALAKQTFEARVALEVRERFDYLYDEILRQLAEGEVAKLGPDAPPPPNQKPAPEPEPAAGEHEAPTRTAMKVLEEPPARPAPAEEAPKPPPASVRTVPAPNPETAELEKNDPRHAAARRLARLSVSEIKLYHEDEVKTGREAKDLWKRMSADIALAVQTFEKRVDREVRERFDYLYDEILRQLAEGDVAKLGADAPKPAAKPVAEPPKPAAEAPKPAPAPAAKAPEPAPAPAPSANANTNTNATGQAAAIAARYAPAANPATAELEKSDPRHAAARRLARLSVSEIKLYHEDQVKAGREAKDLWKRLMADIGLATQTYEKRVDKEVRERFDYLYDEILRQLAEGDASKLGPDAPSPSPKNA